MVAAIKRVKKHAFSKLLTWIVGTQYYDGQLSENQPVHFELDPQNEHDENAISVFNTQGDQCGNLPHYDAAIFSPLVKRGWIQLHGHTTNLDEDYRAPVILEVDLTDKGTQILQPVLQSDYSALLRNLLVNIWINSALYSPDALRQFRDTIRETAHQPDTPVEMRFLYRMLRGRIEERKAEIQTAFRSHLMKLIKTWHRQPALFFQNICIIPFSPVTEKPAKRKKKRNTPSSSLVRNISLSDIDWNNKLPELFPYPKNTQAMAIFQGQTLIAIHGYAQPGAMQTNWFTGLRTHLDNLTTLERQKSGIITCEANTIQDIFIFKAEDL